MTSGGLDFSVSTIFSSSVIGKWQFNASCGFPFLSEVVQNAFIGSYKEPWVF